MFGPSCREVAERVARGELDSLGLRDRLLTRFHLFLCRHCRAYAEQLHTIGELARRMCRSDAADESAISRLETSVLADLERHGRDT